MSRVLRGESDDCHLLASRDPTVRLLPFYGWRTAYDLVANYTHALLRSREAHRPAGISWSGQSPRGLFVRDSRAPLPRDGEVVYRRQLLFLLDESAYSRHSGIHPSNAARTWLFSCLFHLRASVAVDAYPPVPLSTQPGNS